MQTEAIKYLFAHFVVAIGGLFGKAAAEVGAGQTADREGRAIHNGKGWDMGQPLAQGLPQLGLDPNRIGCLTDKSGAMDAAPSGEPISPMASEVGKDPLVRFQAEELAHDFHGQHFTITERGLRATLAKALALQEIVHKAEHKDQTKSR